MFGYVRPPLKLLPQEEQDRFRRVYCGLCHELSRRYGFRARFLLNFDFTFLAILLSEGEESCQLCGRCPASPVRSRPYDGTSPALELAADESVILAYWQLRDGAQDHGLAKGSAYRALCGAIAGPYRKAAERRPAFDAHTRQQLDLLSQLERENCDSMDRAADAFAALLSGAAGEVDDPVRRRVLQQMLYHLGRWIYLVDAADDLKEDAAAGNYNPVALRYGLTEGQWTPEARLDFGDTLDHSIHMIATAFELGDFGVWRPLLESTVYTGLFAVGKAVLDGTYRRMVRGGHRKKHKKDEETT